MAPEINTRTISKTFKSLTKLAATTKADKLLKIKAAYANSPTSKLHN